MIYFIRSYNEFVKIGTSIDPEERKTTLQTANPKKLHIQAVLEGSYETEKGLHELFEKHRVRGEWFRYTEEIKWYIRAIQANPDMKNIYTLYRESQKMRLLAKAKRLGKDHKLSKRINKYKSEV
jgi:hypothetical protein